MNIDSHQHFWRYDPQRDAWITDEMSVLKRDFLPQDLIPELAANGVAASIAVQADQSERETLFLLECAAQHREIAAVVGWVDLCAPNLPERLGFFSQFKKLRGFRHIVQGEPDDRFLLREDFCRGVACLSEFGFTYDILIYPKQLPAACEFVERFPDQPFVIDHLAKPAIRAKEIDCWREQIRAVAAHPNVFCKLSGVITEADWSKWSLDACRPYLDVVFEAFGADRLMFGSDWPVCLLAGTYRQVKDLIGDYTESLSGADRERVFGLSAARFYGLNTVGED
ncbi:MAG TPA: amidohydrolase family protein [Candidatus Acidoferrales bacterium]|nr:amidohydrolase family protein [Candidatus Acidoferrales bacterium]